MSTAALRRYAPSQRHLSPVPQPKPTTDDPPAEGDDPETAPPRLRAVTPLADPPGDDPCSPAPDPPPEFVSSLAIAVFEVVEGLRSATQLGAAVTFNVLRQLGMLCAARRDQLTVLHLAPRSVQRAGSVRVDHSTAGVAETTTVLHVGARARSVAMRLEWIGRRWRATELAVL